MRTYGAFPVRNKAAGGLHHLLLADRYGNNPELQAFGS